MMNILTNFSSRVTVFDINHNQYTDVRKIRYCICNLCSQHKTFITTIMHTHYQQSKLRTKQILKNYLEPQINANANENNLLKAVKWTRRIARITELKTCSPIEQCSYEVKYD